MGSDGQVDAEKFLASVDGWIRVLAARVARRYRLEFDDAYQTACLHVLKQLQAGRYNPAISKPTTWVGFIVSRYLSGYARDQTKRCHRTVALEDLGTFTPIAAADPEQPRDDELARLDAAVRQLPPLQRKTIENYFGRDGRAAKNSTVQADERGVTRAAVRAIKVDAIRKLRNVLAGGPAND